MDHGKFNKEESSKFASGGEYSTPHKRQTEAKASDFLQPGERKYPYKVNGRVSKHLLTAAVRRAKEFGHADVAKKAQRLLDEHTD